MIATRFDLLVIVALACAGALLHVRNVAAQYESEIPRRLLLSYFAAGEDACKWRIGLAAVPTPAQRPGYWRYVCGDGSAVTERTVIR